jgi:hypothetical protein
MIERIRLWWKFEGKYYHKYFIYGIKNLWKWLPIIYRDRDWDQHFIYEVLKTKLEFQAKYIHNNGVHNDAHRDAEKMLLCARLIEIQQEDLYAREYIDYSEKDNLNKYFKKYKRQYDLMDKTDKDDFEIAIHIAHKNQDRSRKLLFKIIEENIESWWD